MCIFLNLLYHYIYFELVRSTVATFQSVWYVILCDFKFMSVTFKVSSYL